MIISSNDLRQAATNCSQCGHEALADRLISEAIRLEYEARELTIPFELTQSTIDLLREIKNKTGEASAVRLLRDGVRNRSLRACMNYVRTL